MMYSLTPFPIVDTLNDHTGFCVILFVVVIFALCVSSLYDDNLLEIPIGLQIFMVLICVASGYSSWTTGTIYVPRNEQVVGELMGVDKVEYSTTCSVGKTSTSCTKIKGVVAYRLPDNSVVSFDSTTGVSYPQRAILYKKD